jgi:hypothetical protein
MISNNLFTNVTKLNESAKITSVNSIYLSIYIHVLIYIKLFNILINSNLICYSILDNICQL